jgi:16S rRNA (uracil1498-N3)-methyltransferase
MRRRWIADTVSPQSGHPTHAALIGEQAVHLARVLRAEPGQVFDVVAAGFLHRAEITQATDDRVDFVLHEELESDSALPLHLYLAVFKFDHLEWAIEKATELGVARITPILARRTEKHLAQAAVKRVERWRRIAHEASQQSRRTSVPTIADPTPLKLALERETAPTRILLSETEQTLSLSQAFTNSVPHSSQFHRDEWDPATALAIGPEGGWTPEEMSLFTQHNWTRVTLGPRILRAETAAIAAIAIAGTYLL